MFLIVWVIWLMGFSWKWEFGDVFMVDGFFWENKVLVWVILVYCFNLWWFWSFSLFSMLVMWNFIVFVLMFCNCVMCGLLRLCWMVFSICYLVGVSWLGNWGWLWWEFMCVDCSGVWFEFFYLVVKSEVIVFNGLVWWVVCCLI